MKIKITELDETVSFFIGDMFSNVPNKYAATTGLLDFLHSLLMCTKDLNKKVYFVLVI